MKTAVLLSLIFLLSSCGNKERLKIKESGEIAIDMEESELDQPVDVDMEEGPLVVFADVLSQVFGPSCVGCHGGYATYEGVSADLNSILREVATDSMPKFGPPLSLDQKMLLDDWVAMGAIN